MAKHTGLVDFTPDAVKEYLDSAIRTWRRKRDGSIQPEALKIMAGHYIDAFQSVRVSMFGELLEGDGYEDETRFGGTGYR